MFTAVAHKNLADAEGYFDEHLSQNDYYAAGKSIQASGSARARKDWACSILSHVNSSMRYVKTGIQTMPND
jgi:hypothetical protein